MAAHGGEYQKFTDAYFWDNAADLHNRNVVQTMVKEGDTNFTAHTPEGLPSVAKYCTLRLPGRLGALQVKVISGIVGNARCTQRKSHKIMICGRSIHGDKHSLTGTSAFNSGLKFLWVTFGMSASFLHISYSDSTKKGAILLHCNPQDVSDTSEEYDMHFSYHADFELLETDSGEKIKWVEYVNSEAEQRDRPESEAASAAGARRGQMAQSLRDMFFNSWFATQEDETYDETGTRKQVEKFVMEQVISLSRDRRFAGDDVVAQFWDADLRQEDPPGGGRNANRIQFHPCGDLLWRQSWSDEQGSVDLLSAAHMQRYHLPHHPMVRSFVYSLKNKKPAFDTVRYLQGESGHLTDMKQRYNLATIDEGISKMLPPGLERHNRFVKALAMDKGKPLMPGPEVENPLNTLHEFVHYVPASADEIEAGRAISDPTPGMGDRLVVSYHHYSRLNPYLPQPKETGLEPDGKVGRGGATTLNHIALSELQNFALYGSLVWWGETNYTNVGLGCPSFEFDPSGVIGPAGTQRPATELAPNVIHQRVSHHQGDVDKDRRSIHMRGAIIEKAVMLGCQTTDTVAGQFNCGKTLALKPSGAKMFHRMMGYWPWVIFQMLNEQSRSGSHRWSNIFSSNETLDAFQLGNFQPNFNKLGVVHNKERSMLMRRNTVIDNFQVVLKSVPGFKRCLDALQSAFDEWCPSSDGPRGDPTSELCGRGLRAVCPITERYQMWKPLADASADTLDYGDDAPGGGGRPTKKPQPPTLKSLPKAPRGGLPVSEPTVPSNEGGYGSGKKRKGPTNPEHGAMLKGKLAKTKAEGPAKIEASTKAIVEALDPVSAKLPGRFAAWIAMMDLVGPTALVDVQTSVGGRAGAFPLLALYQVALSIVGPDADWSAVDPAVLHVLLAQTMEAIQDSMQASMGAQKGGKIALQPHWGHLQMLQQQGGSDPLPGAAGPSGVVPAPPAEQQPAEQPAAEVDTEDEDAEELEDAE